MLDLIKENWEKGSSPVKNEIQYVLDLRAKLHRLGSLSRAGASAGGGNSSDCILSAPEDQKGGGTSPGAGRLLLPVCA